MDWKSPPYVPCRSNTAHSIRCTIKTWGGMHWCLFKSVLPLATRIVKFGMHWYVTHLKSKRRKKEVAVGRSRTELVDLPTRRGAPPGDGAAGFAGAVRFLSYASL